MVLPGPEWFSLALTGVLNLLSAETTKKSTWKLVFFLKVCLYLHEGNGPVLQPLVGGNK